MARRSRKPAADSATQALAPKARSAASLLTRAASLMLLVALAVAIIFARGPLREHVAGKRADPVVVRFAWPLASPSDTQSWLPQEERDRLQQVVLATVSTNPYDAESLDAARASLEATGWFEGVAAVRRLPEGVIEIDAKWRAPAAVVRYAGRDMLVSLSGELLPLAYPAGGAWPLRAVTSVRNGPPYRSGGGHDFGAPWAGGDVQSAIELLVFLRRSAAWSKIAAIDATDFFRKGWLTIITVDGAEMVWGSPPGANAPGEQDDRTKLARVETILNDPAWITAGMPRIDLYPARVLIDESRRGG